MTIESAISALQRVGFVAEERNRAITAGTHTINTKYGLSYNNSFVVVVGIATYQAVIGSTEVLTAKTPEELADLVKKNYVDKGLMKSQYYCKSCRSCIPEEEQIYTFIICSVCGNKRCPKATDCKLECTGSNEPGQKGSVYE